METRRHSNSNSNNNNNNNNNGRTNKNKTKTEETAAAAVTTAKRRRHHHFPASSFLASSSTKNNSDDDDDDDDEQEEEVASLDIGACSLCHCSLDYTDQAAFCPTARHGDYPTTVPAAAVTTTTTTTTTDHSGGDDDTAVAAATDEQQQQQQETGSTDSYYYRKYDPYLPSSLRDDNNALLYCDSCPRLYHQQCHFVPVLVLSLRRTTTTTTRFRSSLSSHQPWECLVCMVRKQQESFSMLQSSNNNMKKKKTKQRSGSGSVQYYHDYPYDDMFRSPPVANARSYELRWERDPAVIAMKSVLLDRELMTRFPKSFYTSMTPYKHARTALQTLVSSRRNREYFLTRTSQELVQSIYTVAKCKHRIRSLVQSLEHVRDTRYGRCQWDRLQEWLEQHGVAAGDYIERTLFPFGSSYPRRWPPVTPEYRPMLLLSDPSHHAPHHNHHHETQSVVAVTAAATVPSHITIHATPPTTTTSLPAKTTPPNVDTATAAGVATTPSSTQPSSPPSPKRSSSTSSDQNELVVVTEGTHSSSPANSIVVVQTTTVAAKRPGYGHPKSDKGGEEVEKERGLEGGGRKEDRDVKRQTRYQSTTPSDRPTIDVDAVASALSPSSGRSSSKKNIETAVDVPYNNSSPPAPATMARRYSTRSSPANGVIETLSSAVAPSPSSLSPIQTRSDGGSTNRRRRKSNEGGNDNPDQHASPPPPTTTTALCHRYSTRSSPGKSVDNPVAKTATATAAAAATGPVTVLSPVSAKRSISSRKISHNSSNNENDKEPETTPTTGGARTRSSPPKEVTHIAKAPLGCVVAPPEKTKSNHDKSNEDGSFSLDGLQCCVCLSGDSSDDNDMILCDGGQCFRAYHANCLHPQVPVEILQDETANWFCPYCQALGDALHTIQRLSMNADEWEERQESRAKAKAAHRQQHNKDNVSAAASWEGAGDVFPEADWELQTALRLKAGEHDHETQRLLFRMLDMEEEEEEHEALAMNGDDDDDNEEEDSNFDVDSYQEAQRRKKEEQDGDQSSVRSSQATLQELSSVELAIGKDELTALKEDGNNSDDNDTLSAVNNARHRRRLRSRHVPNDSDNTSDSDPGKMNPKNILPGKRKRSIVDYRKLNDMFFGDADETELLKLDDAEDFVSPSRTKVTNKRKKNSNKNQLSSSDEDSNSCSDDDISQ